MKRTLALLILLAVALGTAGAAERKTANAIRPGLFELGLYLGEPTGLSAKYYISRTNAIEGIAAWA